MFRRLRPTSIEDLLTTLGILVVGGLIGLTLLYWVTGQVAGRIFGGAWPDVGFAEMGRITAGALRELSDPTVAWPEAAQALLPGPVGFYAVMFGLFVVPAFAGAVLIARLGRDSRRSRRLARRLPADPATPVARPTERPGRPGGPGWARGRDLRKLHVKPGETGRLALGRVDGRLVAAEAGQAVIALGPPGSGKTAGLVVPAVLEWDGPVVVATANPAVLHDTAKRRTELGGVWTFDPAGLSSLPRAVWSPLDAAGSWEAALRTGGSLVTASAPVPALADRPDGPDAGLLLAPLLFAASQSYLGLAHVARWAQRQERAEVAELLTRAGEPAASDAFETVWSLPERERVEAYGTARQVLAPWVDPRVRGAVQPDRDQDQDAGSAVRSGPAPGRGAVDGGGVNGRVSDGDGIAAGPGGQPERFDPAALLDGGVNTLYLTASPHELQRYRPLLVALLQEVLSAAYERAAAGGKPLDPPLLLVLDDAAEVASLRSLDVHASTAGAQGVQLLSVFRNVAQVSARFGERADNVISSHRARIVLSGATDAETLNYLANLVGDDRFRPAAGEGRVGRAARANPPRTGRRLAPADLLRQPRTGDGLLLYGYLPPAALELRLWFRDRRLRGLAGTTRTVANPRRSRQRQLPPRQGRRPPRARDLFPEATQPPARQQRQRP